MRVHGDALRALRTDRGWTLKHLADRVGVHLSRISKVERPSQGLADETVKKIAKEFGVPLQALTDPDYPYQQHLKNTATDGGSETAA